MADVSDMERALADPAEWGENRPSKPRKSEKRRRGAMVSVRLTDEELQAIEGRAQRAGLGVAAFLRKRALEDDDQRSTSCGSHWYATVALNVVGTTCLTRSLDADVTDYDPLVAAVPTGPFKGSQAAHNT